MAHFRAVTAAVGIASAGVVLVLGFYTHGVRRTGLDAAADAALRPVGSALHPALAHMTAWASPVDVVVISVVLAALLLLSGAWRAAVLCATAPALAVVVNDKLLKPEFARPPVAGDGFAYPSGHASTAFALASVLILLAVASVGRLPMTRWSRVLTVTAATALAGYVSLALVSLRFHYVTDVIGGAAVGVASACLCAAALGNGSRAHQTARIFRSPPPL